MSIFGKLFGGNSGSEVSDALKYAYKNSEFMMDISASETWGMISQGQETAQSMDNNLHNKPSNFEYPSPICLIGQFNYLIMLCQIRDDEKNMEQLIKSIAIFNKKYENSNLENEYFYNMFWNYPSELYYETKRKYNI